MPCPSDALSVRCPVRHWPWRRSDRAVGSSYADEWCRRRSGVRSSTSARTCQYSCRKGATFRASENRSPDTCPRMLSASACFPVLRLARDRRASAPLSMIVRWIGIRKNHPGLLPDPRLLRCSTWVAAQNRSKQGRLAGRSHALAAVCCAGGSRRQPKYGAAR